MSMHEYKRLKFNSIHVTGISFEKHGDGTNHAVYQDVKLGGNVNPTHKFTKKRTPALDMVLSIYTP